MSAIVKLLPTENWYANLAWLEQMFYRMIILLVNYILLTLIWMFHNMPNLASQVAFKAELEQILHMAVFRYKSQQNLDSLIISFSSLWSEWLPWLTFKVKCFICSVKDTETTTKLSNGPDHEDVSTSIPELLCKF